MNLLFIIIWIWLISEIAWTIAWFWSSSIFLPIVSNIIDFKNALILVAIYHIFWNTSRLSMFYKHINFKIFLLFWIPSVIFTVLWAFLAEDIDQILLKFILWIVLFLFALYSFLNPYFKVNINNKYGIIWWALSWFTAWLIWTGWVLRWAFMSLFRLPKEQYIATIALVALLVDATRIPIYFNAWFLDDNYILLIPFLFLTAFVWSYIWKRVVSFLPEQVFKKIILVWIMLLSLVFVYQWFFYYF